MEVFGKVPLRALTPPPDQRQGATFLDHVEPQGQAPAARHTAIHDEHQRLQGEMPQQDLGIGEKIHLLQDAKALLEELGG